MIASPPSLRSSRFAPLVERLERVRGVVELWGGPLVDLAVRLWLARIFFASAVVKLMTWAATVQIYTADIHVPGVAPATAAAGFVAVELAGAALLAAGLFTRVAALSLLAVVAFLEFSFASREIHGWLLALLALLIARGPGALSLDAVIAPHLARSALPFAAALTTVGRALDRWAGPAALLGLRLALAFAAAKTAPSGAASGLVAVALSALLALGSGTRIAAALLAPIVAWRMIGDDGGIAAAQALALLTLLARGAGPWSIDALLAGRLRRSFPSLGSDPSWREGAPSVVIVGAGFGGVAAAAGLRHAWANVTVIDRRNYHLFQPLLYQVATASLSPAEIATPVRAILKEQPNARVVMGRVTGVDAEARKVLLADGGTVAYDVLVLATGARHSYFGRDEWEGLAPGLKKIDDATAIRSRILSAFERAEVAADAAERARLLTFVIVGAGPTGVELAGAIAELARFGLGDEFREADVARSRIVLIQSGDRVLPAMPSALSAKALAALERLGVEVKLGARVETIDADGVVASGERIWARTVLWAAGVMASPAGRWIGAKRDAAGRIVVNPDLSIEGLADVWAIGDTAACPGAGGRSLPGLAAVAKQQGEWVAKAIRARIEGRAAPGDFRYRDWGSMATIGRKAAVGDFGWFTLSGPLAWWLWGAVHVAFLVDLRSRVAVAFDWFWSYLTYNRGMRLITGAETTAE